jgi:hypothetical protein
MSRAGGESRQGRPRSRNVTELLLAPGPFGDKRDSVVTDRIGEGVVAGTKLAIMVRTPRTIPAGPTPDGTRASG